MEKYIKSPMNYTGGKYKLLNQILPLFPKDINTFIDLFAGGCNVAINVNANRIIANDLCSEVISVYKGIQDGNTEENIKMIEKIINKYNLSKENKEGYLELRNNYNNGNKEWYVFYTLLAYSFNNQIRFNKKGEFNMPFGKNKSSFNPTLKQKFKDFSNAIHNKNIKFTNNDFRKLNVNKLGENDFVYLDPPYLVTEATYNTGWNEETEKDLLSLCDRLNEKGMYTKEQHDQIIVTYAADNMLKSKPTLAQAHRVRSVMQNYYFLKEGAISIDMKGILTVNIEKMVPTARKMLEEIVRIQVDGDFAKGEKYVTDNFIWTNQMETMAENIKRVSKTLNGKVEEPLADKLLND